MNRRKALAVLGLGGLAAVGGGAYVVTTDPDDETPPPSLDQPSPEESLASLDTEEQALSPPSASFSFDYQPVSETFDTDPLIGSIRARPAADATGDRLRFTPGAETTADELASTLRVAWNVGEGTQVTGQVDGEAVTFAGGTRNGYGILVGPHQSAGTVVASRGESMTVARRLATEWML